MLSGLLLTVTETSLSRVDGPQPQTVVTPLVPHKPNGYTLLPSLTPGRGKDRVLSTYPRVATPHLGLIAGSRIPCPQVGVKGLSSGGGIYSPAGGTGIFRPNPRCGRRAGVGRTDRPGNVRRAVDRGAIPAPTSNRAGRPDPAVPHLSLVRPGPQDP